MKTHLFQKQISQAFIKKSFVHPLHQDIQAAKSIKRLVSTMPEFPPEKVRVIVFEVAALLKERKQTVSVAETVCSFPFAAYDFAWLPILFGENSMILCACLMKGSKA